MGEDVCGICAKTLRGVLVPDVMRWVVAMNPSFFPTWKKHEID